jgi:predicted alpha/beta superfamily hydrolase
VNLQGAQIERGAFDLCPFVPGQEATGMAEGEGGGRVHSKERESESFDAQGWQDYPTGGEHTVVGTIRVSPPLYGPAKGVRRRLFVYLPPSYGASEKRYPVLYMHDGQNIFDEVTSYSGEWQVDETMEALSLEGIEAIVVGVPNSGSGRTDEYSAHVHSVYGGGGGAEGYLDFLAHKVKPLVDGAFRTLPGREYTGLMGSSMGGSISLYGMLTRPEVFGFAGVMSPAFWWSEGTIDMLVASMPYTGGRIYMDVGDNESPEIRGRRKAYVDGAVRMVALLREKGYKEGSLCFVIEAGGDHSEAAWARRLPGALRFLLGPLMGREA